MTRIFIVSMLALALTACSDKPTPPPAAPAAVTVAAAPAITVSTVRPAAIPDPLSITQDCSVDTVNDAVAIEATVVANKAWVRLSGWAADPAAGSLPKAVFLEIGGAKKVYAPVTLGVARPDVAIHFSKPALANAGWQASLDMTAMQPGNYELRIIQLNEAGGSICDTRKALTLN